MQETNEQVYSIFPQEKILKLNMLQKNHGVLITGIKEIFYSVIQIATDFPVYIDSPVGLAAHEGYPGHHVYNILLEQNLVKDKGWIEYTVYPLYSPQSLIAEGTAVTEKKFFFREMRE